MGLQNTLYRLEDNLWLVNSRGSIAANFLYRTPKTPTIKLKTPSGNTHTAYKVAKVASQTINQRELNTPEKLDNYAIRISDNGNDLNGLWQFQVEKQSRNLFTKLIDKIPFFHKVKPQNTFTVKLVKAADKRIETIWQKAVNKEVFNRPIQPPELELFFDNTPILAKKIAVPAFRDPWTKLATMALQSVESPLVYGPQAEGKYRFELVNDGHLRLVEIQQEEVHGLENTLTTRAYLNYLKEEYGEEVVKEVDKAYGLNFHQMLADNIPLTPSHVFKINIGVNAIKMDTLIRTVNQLKYLNRLLNEGYNFEDANLLPHRILRGLFRQINPDFNEKNLPKPDELKAFLTDKLELNQFDTMETITLEDITAMPPKSLNHLVKILTVPDHERFNIFTGREIKHLAICGYPTMGDKSKFDPTRDFHELFQTFPDMTRTDSWSNFYEMLAHVAAKKQMFSIAHVDEDPSKETLKVGLLIPGPKDIEGQDRWYYVKYVLDDAQGSFNYFLEPASNGYRQADQTPLPVIKLYRSTASDKNAVNSEDSIDADLNAFTSPGDIDPKNTYRMENPAFDQRTIPVWVGYLLRANELSTNRRSNVEIQEACKKALKWYKRPKQIPDDDYRPSSLLSRYLIDSEALSEEHVRQIIEELGYIARSARELPEFKLQQDIVFVGHSLGGALAQQGLTIQSSKRKRMACPGFTFKCYAANPPAIDTILDSNFLKYGREIKELLQISQPRRKIEVDFQLECGDFVPESGESHLGTTDYQESDSEWLDWDASIFEVLKSAQAKEITTMPTHGRRIGLATEGIDYKISKISNREMNRFDHAWILPKELRHKFKLNCPKIMELTRRIVGAITYIFRKGYNYCHDKIHPPLGPRNKKGILFVSV